ncbi:MAG TPA: glycosyltransferase family A protein [Phycisphaerales bacterium]|nr:glycosyltransferase family A protein [Phycisphaerales bacterium]
MVSYLIRTRNRPQRVQQLLRDIAHTHGTGRVREVVVIDDASEQRLICPARLGNGLELRSLWCTQPEGWAAFNGGAHFADARSEWLVFLQDDTCPVSGDFAAWLSDWDPSVAAVAPDVFVDAHGLHEAQRVTSSLPETLPTRAFAVRRSAFLRVGGFSRDLAGPGAVVDLCAKLIESSDRVDARSPARIVFDPRWVVARRACPRVVSPESRLRQLRDYAFALACRAPEQARAEFVRCVDDAVPGGDRGTRRALARVLREARSMPLGGGRTASRTWDRLVGIAAVREALGREHARRPFATAALVEPGAHGWVVGRVLAEMGVEVRDVAARPDVLVIASLAPAQMLAGMFRETARSRAARVLAPWVPAVPGVPGASIHQPAAAA